MLFDVIWNTRWKTPVTVYAVDTYRNTFLIDAGGEFLWVNIDEFKPIQTDSHRLLKEKKI
jgi:hypothetical protein